MTTILLIKDINVYNEDGLFARCFPMGQTVRGTFDPSLDVYECVEDGVTFYVYSDEAVAC